MRGILRSVTLAALSVCLMGGLGACSSLKSALGIEKTPPDEFAVVTKAPLVLPPDFALHPPRPGAQDTQQLTPAQSAEQTVFGKVETQQVAATDMSQGELALLESAGADRADSTIRTTMVADGKATQKSDENLTNRLMFWKSNENPADQAVNGAAEQDRIRQNEAEGKSPAEDSGHPAKTQKTASSSSGGFFSHLWPF